MTGDLRSWYDRKHGRTPHTGIQHLREALVTSLEEHLAFGRSIAHDPKFPYFTDVIIRPDGLKLTFVQRLDPPPHIPQHKLKLLVGGAMTLFKRSTDGADVVLYMMQQSDSVCWIEGTVATGPMDITLEVDQLLQNLDVIVPELMGGDGTVQ